MSTLARLVALACLLVFGQLLAAQGQGISSQTLSFYEGGFCSAENECCPQTVEQPGVTTGTGKASQTGGQATPAGSSTFRLDVPGEQPSGQGLVGCYMGWLLVTNTNYRAYRLVPSGDLQPGCLLPMPGASVFTWDSGTSEGCASNCSQMQIAVPCYAPSSSEVTWGDRSKCVCPPIQFGGPTASDPATFAPSHQDTGAPGKPIVFKSDKSGAQLWWHNPMSEVTDPAFAEFLEVKHWDGTVAHYSKCPGFTAQEVNSAGTAIRSGSYWQLDWTSDAFDNKTKYFYDSMERLVRVAYPNGVNAHWNWSPLWLEKWPGCSAIEVRNTASENPPTWGLADDAPHADSWFMVFENLSSTQRHFAGLLKAHFNLRAPYVADPAAGQLIDVSSSTMAHRVTEFLYGTKGAAAGEVSEVVNYWHPVTLVVGPRAVSSTDGRVVTLINIYASGKIAEQQLPHLGLVTTYEYGVDAVTATPPSGVTLQTHRTTRPDYTVTIREFDPTNGRIYREIHLPGTAGKPRVSEIPSGSGLLAEPDKLVVDYTYDATCVCKKPIRVDRYALRGSTQVGLHTTRFEYDPVTKWVTKVYSPNPSNQAGQPAEISETTEYEFDAAAVWSPRWIKKQTTVDGVIEYAYPNPMAREFTRHGSMQGMVVRTHKAVRRQTNLTTVVTDDIVDYVIHNIPGNTLMSPLAYSGPPSGFPRGQARSAVDGDGVEQVFQYDSSHGRLSAIWSGDVSTLFVHDWWGRLQTVQTNSTSAVSATWTIVQGHHLQTLSESTVVGTTVETHYHYDKWGNTAVVLKKNTSSSGGQPTRHGIASSARPWIRSEYLWQDNRLLESRVDRRPLDEGDASPFSTSNPLMLVTKHEYVFGTTSILHRITTPNGAVTEQQFDGFGTPFKATVYESDTSGAPKVQVSRVYNDEWMAPTAVVTGDIGSAATSRTTRITRNAAGAALEVVEPAPPSLPAGAKHQFVIDTSGRTIERTVLDGAGSTVAGRWRFSHDQLGRTIKTESYLIGSGTAKHESIATYLDGKTTQVGSTEATDAPLVTRTYDGNGRLATVTDLAGNVSTYAYLAGTGWVSSVTRAMVGSPLTFVTSYQYDALGRVTSSSEGSSSPLTTTYTYTSLGNVEQITDPMGRVQKMVHDALGRRIEHVRLGDAGDFIRNAVTFVDSGVANGRTYMQQFDGLGHETRTHFDFAGRMFAIQNPGADLSIVPASLASYPHTEMLGFDEMSQPIKRYDGDNGVTQMTYDGAGRLIQRELLGIQEPIATFNTKDVLTRDPLGRITKAKSYSGVNGGAANGTPVVHDWLLDQDTTYDSLSRVHEESFKIYITPGQPLKVSSTFAGVDRYRETLRYDDSLGIQPLNVQFGRDTAKRLDSVQWDRTGSGSSYQALASYAWLGNMRQSRSMTYDGASALETYHYDAYGRMTQMKDTVTPTGGTAVEKSNFDYVYDAASNLKKEIYAKVGGWVGDRFTYDAYHRLQQAYMGVDASIMTPTADPTGYSHLTTDKRIEYDLDVAQNRVEVRESTRPGTNTFDYDLESSGLSNRYFLAHSAKQRHDNRGNLIYDGQFYYRYDFLNRLQEVWRVHREGASAAQQAPQSGEKYIVVEDGALEESRKDVEDNVFNLMRRVPLEHKNGVFRERLTTTIPGGVITVPAEGASGMSGGGMPQFVLPANLDLVALYGYDAFNRRVIRVVIGYEAWVSTYDGWREVAEHKLGVVGGALALDPVKQFVHGSSLDEMLAYRHRSGTGWANYHVLHGGQDTAAKLVDQNGAVVESYEYDPFGKASIFVGSSTTPVAMSSKEFCHLWKGIRLDPETGMLYMRNRFYSTVTGRFASRDPIGVWGDAGNMGNEYAYAWNRPLVVGDPLGLQGWLTNLSGLMRNVTSTERGLHVILTNFGAFPGFAKNASQDFTGTVKADLGAGGVSHYETTLPVKWGDAAKKLDEIVNVARLLHPKKCIFVVGVGRGNNAVPELETLARNKRGPESDGTNWPGYAGFPEVSDSAHPPSYSVDAPPAAKELVDGTGIREDSNAGQFVCEELAFFIYSRRLGIFVHVPDDPSVSKASAKELAKRLILQNVLLRSIPSWF